MRILAAPERGRAMPCNEPDLSGMLQLDSSALPFLGGICRVVVHRKGETEVQQRCVKPELCAKFVQGAHIPADLYLIACGYKRAVQASGDNKAGQ